MNFKKIIAFTIWGGLLAYSIATSQYLIIPYIIIFAIALLALEKVINFAIFKIEKIMDKGKSDKFLPIICTELTDQQKEYVLNRLSKLKGAPEIEIASLADQLIKIVTCNELSDSDLEILNKLLKLRLILSF